MKQLDKGYLLSRFRCNNTLFLENKTIFCVNGDFLGQILSFSAFAPGGVARFLYYSRKTFLHISRICIDFRAKQI